MISARKAIFPVPFIPCLLVVPGYTEGGGFVHPLRQDLSAGGDQVLDRRRRLDPELVRGLLVASGAEVCLLQPVTLLAGEKDAHALRQPPQQAGPGVVAAGAVVDA